MLPLATSANEQEWHTLSSGQSPLQQPQGCVGSPVWAEHSCSLGMGSCLWLPACCCPWGGGCNLLPADLSQSPETVGLCHKTWDLGVR